MVKISGLRLITLLMVLTQVVYAAGSGSTATAGGTSSASSTVGIGVPKQAIVENVTDITFSNLNVLTASDPAAGTGTFRIRANAATTQFDVYVTAASSNVDARNNRFLALNSASSIPVAYQLSGGSAGNAVNHTTVGSSKPNSGGKSAGLGVSGANRTTGTSYTISLTPKVSEVAGDIPDGTYSLALTVNCDVSP